MTLRAAMLATLAACGGVTPAPDHHVTWSVDHQIQDGALLGVWGTGPEDVWAVGGQAGRSIIVHGDGSSWTPAQVNAPAILFSVYGFARTDVYAVGEGGLVLHFDGVAWTRIESGTTSPLFGVWGASGDDVWIVGGTADAAIMLRGNQHGFTPVLDLPSGLMPNALFKVHGFAADAL